MRGDAFFDIKSSFFDKSTSMKPLLLAKNITPSRRAGSCIFRNCSRLGLKINLYLSDTRIYLNFKKIDECKCQILSLIYHYYHWFDNDFQSKYYLSYFLSCFYGRRNSTSTKSSSRGKWFLNP